MEACWVDAILIGLVGIGLFQSQDPLIPLWVPFVLIIGSGLLSSYLEDALRAQLPYQIRTTTQAPPLLEPRS